MKPDTIIVGGKGFVGAALAVCLEPQGWPVRVVDVDNYVDAVGATCDLLINANGNSKKYLSDRDPVLDFELSVLSVQKVAHDFRAAMTVHISSVDVYPDVSDPSCNAESTSIDPGRLSNYGFHKLLAEQVVQHTAPRWLICRAAGFVGPGLKKNPIFDVLNGQPLHVHPESRYQYLHTHDFAAILAQLVDRGIEGEIVNVCGNGLISLGAVAAMVPGYTVAEEAFEKPRQTYWINNEKLNGLTDVPDTQDTVAAFVKAMG